MSDAILKQDNFIRHTDPNVLQNKASNPQSSVWVGASAGSGKTKVLTDRILRLLLPDQKNLNACAPNKILALTFTKTAASEMNLRINERLSEWAVMDLDGEKSLKEDLKKLLGMPPTEHQIEAAQKLFASVVDTPGGLKIMTIHSFCQSILGRFPLEADLTPSFKPLEELQASELLKKAQRLAFKRAKEDKGSPLSQAVHHITLFQNEEQFSKLLQNLISERRQLKQILDKNFGADGLYTNLCKELNIPAGQGHDEYLYRACAGINMNEEGLWRACKALETGTEKTDQPKGIAIQAWLEKDQKSRVSSFDDYTTNFITTTNTIRTSMVTIGVKNKYPDVENILQTEALRIFEIIQKLKAIEISVLTRDLFMLGEAILYEYQNLKNQISALDFDDLILRTLDLLQGKTHKMQGLDVSPWVRYKLDQGIDHILVDEAQDTNPEQWKIIDALTDDFFNDRSNEINRTLFVVGDQKQSIFSFQRASPEKFIEMRQWFKNKIKSQDKNFEEVNFNVSFRSVKSVLNLVDSIFSIPEIKAGLDTESICHESFRYTQAGLIELWPIFENPKKEEFDPWEPPINVIDSSSGSSQMASHIANKISSWIGKEDLKSYDRKIQAGDIMILVRSRTAFIDQLVRALKLKNIPVSGVDRMTLSKQLVVQDLCASAQFSLLPDDDLTLATLLKSPFIGFNEDQIFDVCYGRDNKSLWTNVKEKCDAEIINWLENLIHNAGRFRPYEFFTLILQTKCPTNISGLRAIKSRLGEESLDPLDEFLNCAIGYEGVHIPTLQNFIQSQLNNESQIKREMEEAGNAVRIMTVHGAKGLQAPIVILPDTIRTGASVKPKQILWPDKSDDTLPYFCPTSANLPDKINTAMTVIKDRENQEYRRLLYVALTRAEERLYIGGFGNPSEKFDDYWYNYVRRGFALLPHTETLEDGALQYKNDATDKPDNIKKNIVQKDNKTQKTPQWLFEIIDTPKFPPRPLRPSRPSESEAPQLSPLKANNDYRFLRGNITHKLLQILPNLSSEYWQEAAQKYVSQPAHNLPIKIQKNIIEETLKILNDSKFSKIFGDGSMAEVPITGLIGNRLVSGQIDRLLVTQDEVFILDYKTNRPPPKQVKDVPQIYINQMQAYADVMKKIYKNKVIRTALIWTDGAQIMELPVL